eukprot:scaffold167005_cov52-Attheya_sp.AAC.1
MASITSVANRVTGCDGKGTGLPEKASTLTILIKQKKNMGAIIIYEPFNFLPRNILTFGNKDGHVNIPRLFSGMGREGLGGMVLWVNGFQRSKFVHGIAHGFGNEFFGGSSSCSGSSSTQHVFDHESSHHIGWMIQVSGHFQNGSPRVTLPCGSGGSGGRRIGL